MEIEASDGDDTMTDAMLAWQAATDSRGGMDQDFSSAVSRSRPRRLVPPAHLPFLSHILHTFTLASAKRAARRAFGGSCHRNYPRSMPDEDGRTADSCISHQNLVLLQLQGTALVDIHAVEARR